MEVRDVEHDPAVSDLIDKAIVAALENFDGDLNPPANPFEGLVGLGDLVDQLSIINAKLFALKDAVMTRSDTSKWVHESQKTSADEFKVWATTADVALCQKRSQVKNAIDAKVQAMIGRALAGKADNFAPEVKKYGDNH